MKTEWQTVPKEPTDMQLLACASVKPACKCEAGYRISAIKAYYRQMLEAAPKPEPAETSCDKEIFDLGLKVKFLIEQASKSGAVQYLAICPNEQVLALSEKFSSEEEKVMLDYLNQVKPIEKVEGLAEALNYMDRTKAMEFYNGTDRSAILQAARLWLRKQGER